MRLIIARMISAGDRLHDFMVLIGNEFTSGQTGASEIGAWSQCANIPGK